MKNLVVTEDCAMSSCISKEENYRLGQGEEIEEKEEEKRKPSIIAKYIILYIYSKCCILMSAF